MKRVQAHLENPTWPRRRRASDGVLATLLTLILGPGCATLPTDHVQRSLYSDTRQVVDTRQRIGWVIDRTEYEGAAPSLLQSVCQVHLEKRIELLDWLDSRIEEEGGPAEAAYRREGEDLDAIDELLTLERMRGALEYADALTNDDCPFWLEPDEDFDGIQTDTFRFVLLAESFGAMSLILRGGVQLGGGGALRILPGYGLNDRLTLAGGIEIGGSGALSGVGTDEKQEIVARPTGALPVLLRVHDDTWVYDLELAALTQYYEDSLSFPPGGRIAVGGGIKTVRIGSIMPIAVGFVAYEIEPAYRDLPVSHAFRIGTRVGIDYDP
ncbi:MAG: hypothetical protein DRI90_10320 [Deltaproteobacteria bacterium]|nr:MAG: hypothetical protein DRI90_10320 [Deltaproteobacteria bacterium]